jgi:hypothetical protein
VTALEELGEGLWRWALRHPDWHPPIELGREVGCFAARAGGRTILIDPLLDEDVAAELDALVAGDVIVAVTIPYHVRSAAEAARRWDARVVGHPDLALRLPDDVAVHEHADGVRMHPIVRHKERPVELPALRALAFGDRVVGVDGGLRVWMQREVTEARRAWYRSTLVPWLAPLLELDVERVLVTHGPPVLSDGRAALAAAFEAEPWNHRPG